MDRLSPAALAAVRAQHAEMRARQNAACRWWRYAGPSGEVELIRGPMLGAPPPGYDPAQLTWVAAPAGEHGRHVGRRWIADAAAADRATLAAELDALTRLEFYERIMAAVASDREHTS